MKKLLCFLLVLLLLCGCTPEPAAEDPTTAPTSAPTSTPVPTEEPQRTELSDIAYDLHTLAGEGITLDTLGTEPHAVTSAVTWVANELVLNAQKTYADPYKDVDVDLLLTNGTVTYKIPGFWDGNNVWRVRFVCPTAGQWTYETVCTDTTDAGLHGIKGTLTCTEYSGKVAVYQHGFVTTDPLKRYFIYNDGTPFFYLGDTHWSLGGEKADMVQKMTDQRVKQGFTVIQSEPLDATFDMENGISKSDMAGLKKFDKLFQIIADHGLVHANAEFFFVGQMENAIKRNGGYSDREVYKKDFNNKTYHFYDLADETKDYLKRLSRYWVARYAAYPVFWTLAQECDAGCYWEQSPDRNWGQYNNPYKYVAEYIAQYDPYQHPLSAHQENIGWTVASTSSFRDVSSHTWWASQWSQAYNTTINAKIPMDYYNKGQGKPAVLYEGKYCYLWTKNFGARVQGWMAFLSGMCGYGWGGQDTWSYRNTYDEKSTSSGDGVDVITSEEKKNATYESSFTYPSAYQVGYMRAFFEKIVGNWYELVPRWNSTNYLARSSGALALYASSEDMTKGVCYFYQSSDKALMEKPNADKKAAVRTGTLHKLIPNGQYGYLWFDPVDGKTTGNGTFTADGEGGYVIGDKADRDMIFFYYKL